MKLPYIIIINNLFNSSIRSLCVGVLDRLEQELGRGLPVATMCLLYLSTRGLHETELLTLLADEENLLPRMRKGRCIYMPTS